MSKVYLQLAGTTYGLWAVNNYAHYDNGHHYWSCTCQCGITIPVRQSLLVNGTSKSCGCVLKSVAVLDCRGCQKQFNTSHGRYRNKQGKDVYCSLSCARMHIDNGARHRAVPMIGRVFGRLTVNSEAPRGLAGKRWHCVCSCGVSSIVLGQQLRSGEIVSCGCYAREQLAVRATKHGHSRGGRCTPELIAWNNFRGRCYDPKDIAYKHYGGRGIKVCHRWLGVDGFSHFIEDMGVRPTNNHSIDRIDTNGDYAPENCRWATSREQANNRRNNHVVEWLGRKQTISEWSRELGISTHTLRVRLARWPTAIAMTKPLRNDRRRHEKRV